PIQGPLSLTRAGAARQGTSRLTLLGCRSPTAVEVDDAFDGAAAHLAKADGVAREHDAVGLRTIVAFCLVIRPFERADLSAVRPARQERRIAGKLLAKQRVHLRLRAVRGPKNAAALL